MKDQAGTDWAGADQAGTGQEAPAMRLLARSTLSDGWSRLERVTVEQATREGGRQVIEREVYHRPTGAAVLPVDPLRGTVLLVRQLRVPAWLNGDQKLLVEACAGVVESGDDPAETARQEAEQEMGVRLHGLRLLCSVYMSPGACTEKLHLFAAGYSAGDRIGPGGGLASDGEQIEVLELPLRQAWEWVTAGRIIDAKTILLLQQARLEAS